jgi:hypothetical protein
MTVIISLFKPEIQHVMERPDDAKNNLGQLFWKLGLVRMTGLI